MDHRGQWFTRGWKENFISINAIYQINIRDSSSSRPWRRSIFVEKILDGGIILFFSSSFQTRGLRCVEEYRRERVDVSRVESVYSFDRDEIENTSMEAHVAIDQASSDPYLRNNRRWVNRAECPRRESEREASERVCRFRSTSHLHRIRPDRAAIDKYRDEPNDFTRKVRLE